MPKILINEIDETLPGLPGRYSNYSVLIPGWVNSDVYNANRKDEDYEKNPNLVKPDVNGVFEFSSEDKFKSTIGKTALEHKKTVGGGITTIKHYGNKMAIELLKLGYPIVYAPIEDKDKTVDLLSSEDFWQRFRDKASYDFRFITHGLLESAEFFEITNENYGIALERLKAVNITLEKLDYIKNLNGNIEVQQEIYENMLSKVDSSDADMKAIAMVLMEDYTVPPGEADPNTGMVNDSGKSQLTKVLKYKYLYDKDETDQETGSVTTTTGAYEAVTTEKKTLEQEIADFELEAKSSNDNAEFGPAHFNAINLKIAELAEYVETESSKEIPGRGDCTALIELNKRLYVTSDPSERPENLIIDGINNLEGITNTNGKYCAMTVPSVFYKNSGKVEEFPGAFHYLACFKNSLDMGFAEWYAAAGYTRGVSSYTVDHTSVKLGEIAINALEPRYKNTDGVYPNFACNVIAYFRGSYYLWGNRTAHPLGNYGSLTNGDLTASSFLNIRQLCTTIKKQLYVACRRFTFDPNSDTLWFNFVNAIKPTLEMMKSDQGIRDYKIVKEFTDKKATLKAKIRIIPIEAVEDFDLEVRLEDSFGETVVTAGETV